MSASTTPEPEDDLDELVDIALPFAGDMLQAHGEFFPFGARMDLDGSAAMITADPGGVDQPASGDVLTTMVEGMRDDRDRYRACSLVSDVVVADNDAIRLELEHRDGVAITVLVPYVLAEGVGIEYGELIVVQGEQRIWG